ncbi:MAG: hydrogenase, partial [Deltaproteobacteria bacterium]|nr:hydrogenase [Deltaproteobacteria bacterium]
RLFYGLLAGSMALTAVARDSVLFLMAWEIMALAAFFLITTEDADPAACRAGRIYLIATHLGTAALIALFLLLKRASGSWGLDALPAGALAPGAAAAVFLLALVGFGLKAGLMPLHVWLPGAHANAPSHVSALLSGVMIKMGIYGLIRLTGLFPAPPAWWGAVLLVLGMVSGVLGVAFAIGQHDLKRLLAYHSIENIGIIAMGLGLALLGRSASRPDWIALGFAGALLHVWNHGLFKSALFLAAGSTIHAAGTREIDHLGGLLRRMPWTGATFLLGAVAICGLPPLNGFVSELLIYLALFRTLGPDGGQWAAAALAAPALALIGALAVACFVKVFGVAFLGEPRGPGAERAEESPLSMLAPMLVLSLLCALIGLEPALVAPPLARVAEAWSGSPFVRSLPALAPFGALSVAGTALLGLLAAGALVVRHWYRGRPLRRAVTWDCGYLAPSPSMQYTASSFAQMLVGLFSWALRPRVERLRPPGLFAPSGSFASEVPDTVFEGLVQPAFARFDRLAARLRPVQHGRTQLYILYILAAVVALLFWR